MQILSKAYWYNNWKNNGGHIEHIYYFVPIFLLFIF